MQLTQTNTLLLSGNIVDKNGNATYGYILVENGLITSVNETKPTNIPAGTTEYDAGENSYIFPGLINLHNHIDYNLFPVWDNEYKYTWGNRFEWRNNQAYKNAIELPLTYIQNNWNTKLRGDDGPSIGEVFQSLSEIQAIAGGTTILQENTSINNGCHKFTNRGHILIRNTGTASDMGLTPDEKIESKVDFYEPSPMPAGKPNQDTSCLKPTENKAFEYFVKDYKNRKLKGTLVHIAEGRSGAGLQKLGVDIYTKNEFNTFKDIISTLDPDFFKKTHFIAIHGCGIDVWDSNVISFLKKYNISVIWSPVSNMLLYGDTSFALQLLRENILTSLGSDWSPSGSKHILEEAKYAKFFCDTLNLSISNLSLFQMITTTPAKSVNIPAGEIKAGNFGDFFILKCKDPTITPLEALFKYDDSDTKAVITAGVPVFGEKDVFSAFEGLTPQQLPVEMGAVASTKYVNLPNDLKINLNSDFQKLETLLNGQNVNKLSLPLVVDDINYQLEINDLKKYTLEYARQIKMLPLEVNSPKRIK